MSGKTCAGTLVTASAKTDSRGRPHVYRRRQRDDDARVRLAAGLADGLNPAIALALLAIGDWKGAGVLGPELSARSRSWRSGRSRSSARPSSSLAP